MIKGNKVFVLTIPRAEERRALLVAELDRQGGIDYEFVFGEDHLTTGISPSTAVSRGHKSIVRANMDKPYITIMEDDVVFTSPASWKHYVDHFKYLPENWDMYLGGIYKPKYIDKTDHPNILWSPRYSGFHLYTIRQKFYDKFLSADETKDIDTQMFYLGAASYFVNPVPTIQRGVFSMRRNTKVDYSLLNSKIDLL